MKLISFLLRYSRSLVILSIIAGIIAGISNAGLLALTNRALSPSTSSPLKLAWAFAGLCVMMLVSRIASGYLLVRLSQGAIFDLRMQFSRKILDTSLRHLESQGSHRILALLTEDIPSIALALITIPTTCMQFVVLVACLAYLGWLSLPVLIAVFVFMILGIGTYHLMEMGATRHLRLARDRHDELINHFTALTEGTKELKLHRRRRETFLNRVLHSTAYALRHHNIVGMSIYNIASGWSQLLVFILIGLLLFLVPAYKDVSTQTLVGYILIILYITSPLDIILSALPVQNRANIALKKIESLGLSLSTNTSEVASSGQADADPSWESLEMINVTHTYHRELENSCFTLGPIDLSFRPGELVFLAGGNGSGKTTLAKLLTGLYIPEAGEIRLNGKTINDENRDDFRQRFSVVFSDFYIFDSLLGIEAPELDKQARDYLVRLQLDHKVQVNDGVLSKTDLSQGQRKRLALLTAYLEDRPFYVFDEWAADQDPLFRNIFYLQILPELKARGKTVLAISHDDRYYYLADRIIKLDYGKIEYDNYQVQTEQLSATIPAPTGEIDSFFGPGQS